MVLPTSVKYKNMAKILNSMPNNPQTSLLTGWGSVAGNNFNYQFRVYSDSEDVIAQAQFDLFKKGFGKNTISYKPYKPTQQNE
jgi:hypothetical protein